MAIPLFSGAGPFKVMNRKEAEVRSLQQLWHDHLAIEGGEGRVVELGSGF
jgi:hypothetical protein